MPLGTVISTSSMHAAAWYGVGDMRDPAGGGHIGTVSGPWVSCAWAKARVVPVLDKIWIGGSHQWGWSSLIMGENSHSGPKH